MYSCVNDVTFGELCRKEVICTRDGARLGYIDDLEMDPACGTVRAFLVPAGKGFPFKRRKNYRIELCSVEKIGQDLILVRGYETVPPETREDPPCGC